jgi:tRNA (cmo5U34)-methyltransferase
MKLRALPTTPFYLLRERMTRSSTKRTPEPMVMDEPDSVEQFHQAGAAINLPVYELCALATSHLVPERATILDLGSGSGQYLAHLGRHRPDVKIVGVDLSDEMLATGQAMIAQEGLDERVALRKGDMTDFVDLAPDDVEAVSCVFALHHLPSDESLARCLSQIATVRERSGCAVLIFDFARLRHPKSYEALMSTQPEMPAVLKQDALASERAAFSWEELTEQLERAGLGDLRNTRMRAWQAYQLHWSPHKDGKQSGHGSWREIPLPRARRGDTRLFLGMFPGAPIKKQPPRSI